MCGSPALPPEQPGDPPRPAAELTTALLWCLDVPVAFGKEEPDVPVSGPQEALSPRTFRPPRFLDEPVAADRVPVCQALWEARGVVTGFPCPPAIAVRAQVPDVTELVFGSF